MKRTILFLFAAVLLIGMAEAAFAAEGKVAIISNTVSQNEEEYRSAEQMKAQYGDRIVHVTWPDSAWEEKYMIAIVLRLAENPNIKALIINQARPGTNAAVDNLLERRKDIFIVYCNPHGPIPDSAAHANLVLLPDELGMGETIPVQAQKMGAKTLVHYSFPRHMSIPIYAARRELLKIKCKELGMQFVDAEAPDPVGDLGIPGAQQFILDDVPKMVREYGKDTAFFATNCAMQIPLIKKVVDNGAIYPQPCCPSPYHGFTAALDIVSDLGNPNNLQYVIDETRKVVAATGGTGRVSTWPVPDTMAYTYVGVEYAMKVLNGETNVQNGIDKALVERLFSEYAGVPVTTTAYKEGGKVYPNVLMHLMGYITY